jgi:hypothetical protein
MDRLKIVQEIDNLERRKIAFENVLEDIENFYFKKGSLFFNLDSTNYNKKYNEVRIQFSNELMIDYLKKEIDELEIILTNKIDELFDAK